MENFAIKIDDNVRARLYKICRLCGDDNPNSLPILESAKNKKNVQNDFHKKVIDCVGIQVTKTDRMPQNACKVCRDKINDFFEFREMCHTTDVQTRRLLGLDPCKTEPKVEKSEFILGDDEEPLRKTRKSSVEIKKVKFKIDKPVKKVTIQSTKSKIDKPINKIKFEPEPVKTKVGRKRKNNDNLLEEKAPNKRERLREVGSNRKLKQDEIPAVEPVTRPINCPICNTECKSRADLRGHLGKEHIPRIVSFHCIRCDQSLESKTEIKTHNLWHKLSKTAYECGRCGKAVLNLPGYKRHLLKCSLYKPTPETPAITCQQCKKVFATSNYYKLHKCVLKQQLKCEICHQSFAKRSLLTKHVIRCSTNIPVVDSALNPEGEAEIEADAETENYDEPYNDGGFNDDSMSDTETNIKPSIEIGIETTQLNVEPSRPAPFVVIPSNIANLQNTENHSTLVNNVADTNPVDKFTATAVNIKQERIESATAEREKDASESTDPYSNISSFLDVRIKTEPVDTGYNTTAEFDPEVCRQIKKEHSQNPTTPVNPIKPGLRLVIKKEHGTLNSTFIDNKLPSNIRSNVQKKKKMKKSKLIKIHRELALRIKKEKLERNQIPSNMDDDHGAMSDDSQISTATHLSINPLALGSMRIKQEKPDDYESAAYRFNRRTIDDDNISVYSLCSNAQIKQERIDGQTTRKEVAQTVVLPIISVVQSNVTLSSDPGPGESRLMVSSVNSSEVNRGKVLPCPQDNSTTATTVETNCDTAFVIARVESVNEQPAGGVTDNAKCKNNDNKSVIEKPSDEAIALKGNRNHACRKEEETDDLILVDESHKMETIDLDSDSEKEDESRSPTSEDNNENKDADKTDSESKPPESNQSNQARSEFDEILDRTGDGGGLRREFDEISDRTGDGGGLRSEFDEILDRTGDGSGLRNEFDEISDRTGDGKGLNTEFDEISDRTGDSNGLRSELDEISDRTGDGKGLSTEFDEFSDRTGDGNGLRSEFDEISDRTRDGKGLSTEFDEISDRTGDGNGLRSEFDEISDRTGDGKGLNTEFDEISDRTGDGNGLRSEFDEISDRTGDGNGLRSEFDEILNRTGEGSGSGPKEPIEDENVQNKSDENVQIKPDENVVHLKDTVSVMTPDNFDNISDDDFLKRMECALEETELGKEFEGQRTNDLNTENSLFCEKVDDPTEVQPTENIEENISVPTEHQLSQLFPVNSPPRDIPEFDLNMLHINEIAENNNNANIERERQFDLDSITSNLGTDDATVASTNEIPDATESMDSISGNVNRN